MGKEDDGEQIEWREPPEPGTVWGTSWTRVLEPLLQHPGRWAMVRTLDSVQKAHKAASNLNRRQVKIPEPDHQWSFIARGIELFAIYHGKELPDVNAGRRKGSG